MPQPALVPIAIKLAEMLRKRQKYIILAMKQTNGTRAHRSSASRAGKTRYTTGRDLVILGKTGRDGIGGATSYPVQTAESVETASAEVQK